MTNVFASGGNVLLFHLFRGFYTAAVVDLAITLAAAVVVCIELNRVILSSLLVYVGSQAERLVDSYIAESREFSAFDPEPPSFIHYILRL